MHGTTLNHPPSHQIHALLLLNLLKTEDTMKAKHKSVIPSEVMKRPKLLETLTSFGNLPEEYVVRVLEFLELNDLDAVTMCSFVCCHVHLSPSLNQKRWGVIICSDDTSALQIKKALCRGNWSNVEYSWNQIELVIQKLEKLTCICNKKEMEQREESPDIKLTDVKDLVLLMTKVNSEWIIPPGSTKKLLCDGSTPKHDYLQEVMYQLSKALPNILSIHFCGIIPVCQGFAHGPADLASRFYIDIPKLESFCWYGLGWGDKNVTA
jgi:hypothetical protein